MRGGTDVPPYAGGAVADRDAFSDRRRGLEEEYFHRREKELIEKMQQRSAQESRRQQLADRVGVADQEVLKDLEALGYGPETVGLLHLVPLVQMAWAEGGVSARERELVTEAARARGVKDGSDAARQLAAWLTDRPSEEFFDRTLRVIGAILEGRPVDERAASRQDLLGYVTAIASASGGLMGFGKVSDEERHLLERINQELERRSGGKSA
jgi:hypothetical protein